MKATLAVACILFAAEVLAQPKKPAKQVAAPAKEAPFDDTVATLPAGFRGNSFPNLYRSLVVAPKGEFETTEQYEARRASGLQGKYAFRVHSPYFEYDADRQVLNVQVPPRSLHDGFSLSTYEQLLVLHYSSVEKGSYVASNAFGASRKVDKVVVEEWGVITRRSSAPKIPPLPLPPDRAQTIKPRLGVLLVCEFGPGAIPNTTRILRLGPKSLPPASGYDHDSPTIDSPFEQTTYYYAVPATILGYWVFDPPTGEVLGRFDKEGNPGKNPDTNP